MDVRRRYPGQQRIGAERREKGSDMLGGLHRHLGWQERVGLRLVQSEGQDAASRLHPRADGRGLGRKLAAPARSHHQHLVRRRRLAFEWRGFDPARRQPGQAGGFAGVHRGAPGGWTPGIDIPEDVARQCLGRRVALGSPGHVHLAEKDQPAALAVFKKRAVLEGVAAVNNWQEVTPGRLFNQHRGYVAPVAAAPQPGNLQSAPAHRRRPVVTADSTYRPGWEAAGWKSRASRADFRS